LRKTKIVCTIGPASESPDMLKQLISSGMNVARLNFSHGDFEEHGRRMDNIRQASLEMNQTVAILLDTKGPEIRTGKLKAEPVELIQGNQFILTTEEVLGDEKRVSVTYDRLPEDVHVGSTILIDDGLLGLKVTRIESTEIYCEIVNGGPLKSRKGVNVPGVKVALPGITEKDANDIRFGIEQGIDFIAASFVRKAIDVLEIRELLEQHKATHIQIIAKIENQEGVNNLDEILEVSDGLMVARGDLGVEIPAEEVPLVQKKIIKKCNQVGKPVITATQMLDSMQRNPRPTRAEASDVANAILDGTDAIMLSGETAAGKYPVLSVQTMARIAERTETIIQYQEILNSKILEQQITVTDAISQSVSNVALDLNAAAIITPTESGYTARMVSKYRPKATIIAVTQREEVLRGLQLIWGVIPMLGKPAESTDQMLTSAVETSIQSGLVRMGDVVVITAGVPLGQSGSTNLMKVHLVGDILAKGQGIGRQYITGNVIVARSTQEALDKMEDNAILVITGTDRETMPAIRRAIALVTEEGGITSHAAVVGLNLGIPVIVGASNATSIFKDGQEVSINAERGMIYSGRARLL
jgi:pyruvate kinase